MELDWVLDKGYLPHNVVRWGTRLLLRARQIELNSRSMSQIIDEKLEYVAKTQALPIAIETETANEQQYEVSTGVFQSFLGPRMKYSCSLFTKGNETLAEAETAMLESYIDKAELKDGMKILDLGCGWGSASLYLASRFPASRITGFSNSKSQKDFIDSQAKYQNLENLDVITGNIAHHNFEPNTYDRVVSIEMFEHVKNYERLMSKIATALKPGGKLFVHHFSHKDTPYDFNDGWMARYFFSGGTMPSADLLLYFQRDLKVRKQWWISGMQYSQTMQHWLAAHIQNKDKIWPHLVETYGEKDAGVWYNRWLVYHIAGAEFFSTGGGDVWGISHYLFEKPEL